jgi:hypothetical protein
VQNIQRLIVIDIPSFQKPKKRPKRSALLDRVLYGCSSICFHVVAQADVAAPQLFNAKSLSKIIVFKYPNFTMGANADGGEPSNPSSSRPIETALFVPYDSGQIELGGHGIYLRQKNYKELMLRHLGIDLNSDDPAVKRDIQILEQIDTIPSLDPFLLKPQILKVFPEVDQRYFKISDAEISQTREVIASKVQPIIERALSDVPNEERRTHTDRFLAALWDPTLPEAALFIKAFGIKGDGASAIFEALKGISFYQWNIAINQKPVVDLLKWLQSPDMLPHDMRQNMHHKESLVMFRSHVAKSIRRVSKTASSIFIEFETAHASFLKNGDPRPFRQFLETVPKRYWVLGYTATALAQVTYLLETAMAQSMKGQLTFEHTTELLSLMSMSLSSESTAEES